MRERADRDGVDILLVDTGDRIEGNGLYDASEPKGKYTMEIFKEQTIDILCAGNHELYHNHSSNNEYLTMVPNFNSSYLSSNIDILDPQTGTKVPLAPRYKKFTTKNQGIRIIAFGFLFDFTGNSNNTIVQPLEKTIQEEWFQNAIRDREVDLFLVAGHVGLDMPEFKKIYTAIRNVQWDTPIQFLGGHTHIRDFKRFDAKAYGLESGRYMETIGFGSISGLTTGDKAKPVRTEASPIFARRYIDNNLFSLHHHTSLDDETFPTEHGRNVSALITSSRTALKLDDRFGCAPADLWISRAPYPSTTSIFSWLEKHVLPDMVQSHERAVSPRIVIINTGAIRFDIFKGPFTKDNTYIVSPFPSEFRYLKDVPYEIADRVSTLLNSGGNILEQDAPHHFRTRMLAYPEQLGAQETTVSADEESHAGHDWRHDQGILATHSKPQRPEGYTTKDDAGDEGDDTVHSPVSFYKVPNCIEARINTTRPSSIPFDGSEEPVETVDLVFLEFIQPYILFALQFLGGEYGAVDTAPYGEGKNLSSMLSQWAQSNWNGEC